MNARLQRNVSEVAKSRARLARIVAGAVLLATAPGAMATPIAYSGTTYTQNFDTLLSTGGSGAWSNTSLTDNSVDGTLPGWYSYQGGGGSATVTLLVGTGSGTAGGLYSYGAAGSTERALGSLASGSVTTMYYGLVLKNTTGGTLNEFSVSYVGEQWRATNATAQTLTFDYQLGATAVNTGTWTNVSALNFTSPNLTTGGAINGNTASNQAVKSATITGITWAADQLLFLRFGDVDNSGNDHGFGVDTFSFSASSSTPTLTWTTGTNNNWDTSSSNWLNGATPSTFATGNHVIFGDTNATTVTVDAGGIAAGGVTFNHTTGTYTLAGGNLTAGSISKSAGGTLLINNSVTATGLTVSGGTFGGSGTVTAPVTVSAGVTLAPGSASGAAGTLTVGNLSLTSAAMAFDLDTTSASDKIVSGSLTVSGTSTFTLTNLAGFGPGTYTLIDYTGTALSNVANFALSAATLNGNYVYLVNNTAGTSVDLLVSATPVVFTHTWVSNNATAAWLTASNWSDNVVPSSIDVAEINASGSTTNIGINMNSTTNNGANNQAVGSIRLTGGSTNRIITNSTSSADGTLTLNGASGELLANTTTNATLTLAHNGTGSNMAVSLAIVGNVDVTNAAASIVISADVGGAGGINKTGAGLLTLSGTNNTYGGGTNVQGGTLLAGNGTSGSATGSAAVSVTGGALGSTAAGGTISGVTTLASGTTLLPGGANTASSNPLAFTGGLTLSAGSIAAFDFTSSALDTVSVAGGLTLPAAGAITLTINAGIGTGSTFTLFSFDTLTNPFDKSQFVVPTGYDVQLGTNQILLLALSDKTWAGGDAVHPAKWDVDTTSNWTVSGSPSKFSTGDKLVFDDTGTNPAITIDAGGAGSVSAAQLSFTNSSVAYSFSGDPVVGSPTVAKSGEATVTFYTTGNVLGTTTVLAGALTINGATTFSGDVTVSGGKLALNAANTLTGNVNVSGGTLSLGATGALGAAASVAVSNNAIVESAAAITLDRNIAVGTGGATIQTTADMTCTGLLSGSTTLTKTGTGTLTLATAGSTFTGPINVTGGKLVVNSADANGVTGVGLLSLTSSTAVTVGSGAILSLEDGVHAGKNGVSSFRFVLSSGGTVQASNTPMGGDAVVDGNPMVAVNAGQVYFKPVGTTDKLVFVNSIRNTAAASSSSTVIQVEGNGLVRLASGSTSSSSTATQFSGSWNVAMGSTGVLALGLLPTGGFGEVLNALGYAPPASGSGGYMGQTNAVTVTSGTLAFGADTYNPSTTNGITGVTSFRSPIIFEGGNIASTNYKYTGSTPDAGAGVVSANLAASITISAGKSGTVVTYNPVSGEDTGGRSLNIMNDAVATSVVGNFTWGDNSTLIVEPGQTDGGALNFTRTSGTVTVGTSAVLTINRNEDTLTPGVYHAATANIGGTVDLFTDSADASKHVSVVNAGTLNLSGGNKAIGTIDATSTAATSSATAATAGAMNILGDTQITAARVRQASLSIGDGTSTNAKLTISETAPGASTGTPSGDDAFVSVVKSLTIAGGGSFTGTLDVNNNDVIIDYTGGASPLAAIEAMVKSGYNGGNWLGKGITSSIAAANSGSYSVVVLDNAQRPTPFTSFDGIAVPTTVVIVKFSWVADLDLDGVVTSNDAIVFANNYAEGAASTHRVGDLNYNGVFDSNDAILFANAYNESLPHMPEPASLGMLAIGAAGLLLRRRR